MKKQIWLSFDYELFLGAKSGTPEACLFKPTEMLMESLRALNVRATFFVDASYLVRLRQEVDPLCQAHFEMIGSQLRDLVALGHRVELHLHPHWRDALYVGGGEWSFPSYQSYCIDALADDLAVEHFVQGAEVLTTILGPSYRLCAFRAGGLCVLPFEKIGRGMSAVGLKVDSSVAPGLIGHFSYGSYDFSKMDWVQGPYAFESSPMVACSTGALTEIPIICYRQNVLQKMLNALDRRRLGVEKVYGDGRGVYESRQKSMLSRFLPSFNPLTLDQAHPLSWSRNWDSTKGNGSMLCHPKSLNPTSYQLLEKMAKSGSIDFRLVTEI